MRYNLTAFFAAVRASLFDNRLTESQVAGMEAILKAAPDAWSIKFLAYALATAYHETAFKMQPIPEIGRGKGKKYGSKGKYGQAPYGRGYVQLTWDYNYEKADKELGLNGALLKNFDLALDPTIAAKIMFRGMEEGWFTGKKLGDYFSLSTSDAKGARKIINGTDKDDEIAGYYAKFLDALLAAELPAPSFEEAAPIPEPLPAPSTPDAPSLVGPAVAALVAAVAGLLAALGFNIKDYLP